MGLDQVLYLKTRKGFTTKNEEIYELTQKIRWRGEWRIHEWISNEQTEGGIENCTYIPIDVEQLVKLKEFLRQPVEGEEDGDKWAREDYMQALHNLICDCSKFDDQDFTFLYWAWW